MLIGGIGWSRTTRRVLSLVTMPVEQFSHPDLHTGEVFRLTKTDASEEKVFFPVTENGELVEDVALIARVANPFNSNRTLTILNGVHSRGVLGAACRSPTRRSGTATRSSSPNASPPAASPCSCGSR